MNDVVRPKERRADHATDIAEAVVAAMLLMKHRSVKDEPTTCVCPLDPEHTEEHIIMKRWIANDNLRKERYEKLRASLVAGTILLLIGAIGTGSLWIVNYLREHLK